mmetsp:Transcript_11359/g.17186  ORF Transcript_11359/g.17186 Transcript_11359/m.17186 type:complete len:201 (+) Transcript_11359:742-1344(+)
MSTMKKKMMITTVVPAPAAAAEEVHHHHNKNNNQNDPPKPTNPTDDHPPEMSFPTVEAETNDPHTHNQHRHSHADSPHSVTPYPTQTHSRTLPSTPSPPQGRPPPNSLVTSTARSRALHRPNWNRLCSRLQRRMMYRSRESMSNVSLELPTKSRDGMIYTMLSCASCGVRWWRRIGGLPSRRFIYCIGLVPMVHPIIRLR